MADRAAEKTALLTQSVDALALSRRRELVLLKGRVAAVDQARTKLAAAEKLPGVSPQALLDLRAELDKLEDELRTDITALAGRLDDLEAKPRSWRFAVSRDQNAQILEILATAAD